MDNSLSCVGNLGQEWLVRQQELHGLAGPDCKSHCGSWVTRLSHAGFAELLFIGNEIDDKVSRKIEGKEQKSVPYETLL